MVNELTRTSQTVKEYELKLNTIKRLYAKDLLVDGDIPNIEAAKIVFERFSKVLMTSSVRKYRVVLRWDFKNRGMEIPKNYLSLSGAVVRGSKMKSYPKKSREFMIAEIASEEWCNQKAKEFLSLHLWLGPMFGYRLGELLGSEVVDDKEFSFCFRIKNGKNSNGRSNGEFRELFVSESEVANEVRLGLERLLVIASPSVIRSARRLHDKLRVRIPSSCLYGGKLPVMTSTRHEFTLASRKARSDVETSAAMGHLSKETQRINYGRSGVGLREVDRELVEFIRKISVSQKNIEAVLNWTSGKKVSDRNIKKNKAFVRR